MPNSKFTESQIAGIVQEAEAGVAVAEVARKLGISAVTFYQRRSRYGGMSVSDMQRLCEREQENTSPRGSRNILVSNGYVL
jgi:putative transposase